MRLPLDLYNVRIVLMVAVILLEIRVAVKIGQKVVNNLHFAPKQ